MKKMITYRVKTNFDAEIFIDECLMSVKERHTQCDCNQRGNQTGRNGCVNCFVECSKNTMASNYSNKCPVVKRRIVIKENAKWFNGELREAKKIKRKMEDKWKRSKNSKSEENWSLYKAARNKYNDMIEKIKKTYYNNLFSEEKNPKLIQENLDELLGHKKEKVLPEFTDDYKNLANYFVNYFEEKNGKNI